jgi:hypothetical protein
MVVTMRSNNASRMGIALCLAGLAPNVVRTFLFFGEQSTAGRPKLAVPCPSVVPGAAGIIPVRKL